MSNIARLAGMIGVILTAAAITIGSSLAYPPLHAGPALASEPQMVQHG
jgi:hypothetical protein